MDTVQTQQDAIQLLQSHGVYPTSPRIHIAQQLFCKPQHLNADQIQDLVNQGKTRVSKATIYNTLSLFVRKGLVREIFANPSKVFYDSNVSEHHHVFNLDTGELSDINLGQVDLPALSSLPEGVTAERVDIVVQVRNSESN